MFRGLIDWLRYVLDPHLSNGYSFHLERLLSSDKPSSHGTKGVESSRQYTVVWKWMEYFVGYWWKFSSLWDRSV